MPEHLFTDRQRKFTAYRNYYTAVKLNLFCCIRNDMMDIHHIAFMALYEIRWKSLKHIGQLASDRLVFARCNYNKGVGIALKI